MDDRKLLADYSRNASQSAFEALVQRYLRLVYSAARRQLHTDQLAEDVCQQVFILLAQKARQMDRHTIVPAWLYRTACYLARKMQRRECRRAALESAFIHSMDHETDESTWREIEPFLDEAMAALEEPERAAIVLRFFQGQSLKEVGNALGLSDDAAQKRVSRALEKLRRSFAARGVTVSSANFAALLIDNAAVAVPPYLIAKVAAIPLESGLSSAGIFHLLPLVRAALKDSSGLAAIGILGLSVALIGLKLVSSTTPEPSAGAAERSISTRQQSAGGFQQPVFRRNVIQTGRNAEGHLLERLREILLDPSEIGTIPPQEAIDLIGQLRVEKRAAFDLLRELIGSQDRVIRLRAVTCLQLFGEYHAEMVQPLVELLRTEYDWSISGSAASLLRGIPAPGRELFDQLLAIIGQNPTAASGIRGVLEEMLAEQPQAKAALLGRIHPMLQHEHPAVRLYAAAIVAQHETSLPDKALDALVSALTISNREFPDATSLALMSLTRIGFKAEAAAGAIYEFGKRQPGSAKLAWEALSSVAPDLTQEAAELLAIAQDFNRTPYD